MVYLSGVILPRLSWKKGAIKSDIVVVVVVAVGVGVVVVVVVVDQVSFLKFCDLAGPLEITGAITGQMQFLSLRC